MKLSPKIVNLHKVTIIKLLKLRIQVEIQWSFRDSPNHSTHTSAYRTNGICKRVKWFGRRVTIVFIPQNQYCDTHHCQQWYCQVKRSSATNKTPTNIRDYIYTNHHKQPTRQTAPSHIVHYSMSLTSLSHCEYTNFHISCDMYTGNWYASSDRNNKPRFTPQCMVLPLGVTYCTSIVKGSSLHL